MIGNSDYTLLENLFGKDALSEPNKDLSFLFITNPDNTIRWIYPENLVKPNFLNFYSTSNLKSKLISLSIKSLFALRLGKLVKSGEIKVSLREDAPILKILNKYECDKYSIFTGTKGENRKAVVELHNDRGSFLFVKVALTESSKALIVNEFDKISYLQNRPLNSIVIPEIRGFDEENGLIEISNVKPKKNIQVTKFKNVHALALQELYSFSVKNQKLEEFKFFDDCSVDIETVKKLRDKRPFLGEFDVSLMVNKLETLINLLKNKSSYTVGLSHGDFTPWNLFISKDKLNVFDWELCNLERPLLYDFFHFIFQSSILIDGANYGQIIKSIGKALEEPVIKEVVAKYNLDVNECYSFYLLHIMSYYLKKYIMQEDLHVQVFWLLSVWNESLTKLIESKGIILNEK